MMKDDLFSIVAFWLVVLMVLWTLTLSANDYLQDYVDTHPPYQACLKP
jgi:hypothetical protein